jgi:hypothetical protein
MPACDGCGLRCMDGFTVTRDEYLAARAYLQTLPPDEVAHVLGQEKTVPWPGNEYMTFERKTWAEWDEIFDVKDAANASNTSA